MAKKTTQQNKAAAKEPDIVEDAEVIADADPVSDTADVDSAPPEADQQDSAEPEAPIDDTTHDITPEDALTPVEKPRSVFAPLVLGGVVAAALGYGAATYFSMSNAPEIPDYGAMIADQAAQIAALEAQLATVPAAVDIGPLEAALADAQVAITQDIETLGGSLADIDARLAEVEKRPGADGTLSDTALAAYEREIEALRADMAAQQESVRQMAEEAAAQLAAAQSETQAIEQDAIATAQAATARAALGRIQIAMDTGVDFEGALADLQASTEMDIPQVVQAAAEGVATMAVLQGEFPAAARAAMAAARDEGVAGETGGFGAFLRDQFDVRSVVPREGDDPDAILSRAEEALRSGRLTDALAEIEALPEVSRAALTDWIGRAQARADAIAGVEALSQTLNQN